ncbi:MAG: hypothetical protein K2O09_06920, partial [Treponemataceae bacterium]|nr:hypothetical protein [Treponemataceae bacterium]
VYALNGEEYAERNTGDINPKACVWFNGDVTFSASGAATTNETANDDPTLWYESSGKKILTYSTGGTLEHERDAGYAIHSLARTSDFLLAGTDDGLLYFGLDGNGLPSGTTDSGTNVSSTLSSYYEVHNVLAVNPSLPANGGDIYGTTVFEGTSSNTGASADNQGLWAYYPGRGHWNRE